MSTTTRSSSTRLTLFPLLLAGCTALALVVSTPVLGQGSTPLDNDALIESTTTIDETFSGEASVTLIEIPVRVVTRKGSVAGLTAEDFAIYDRGERKEIAFFRELDAGEPLADIRTSIENPEIREPESPSRDADASRTFILLFDFVYSSNRQVLQSLLTSRSLVAAMHPGDHAAVVFHTALRGLKVITDFTDDKTVLDHALFVVATLVMREPELTKEFGAPLLAHFDHGQSISADIPFAELEEIVAEAGIHIRNDRDWPHGSLSRKLTKNIARLCRWSPPTSGQNHLLYFARDYPIDSLNLAERLFEACRDGNWSIYGMPVVGGQWTDGFFLLAHETGGEAYENFRLADAVERMLDRTRITYLIAFYAEDIKNDRRLHRVDVELTKKIRRARVLHRPGYYSPMSK
ncbi:MAG: hypothetical protein AAGD38_08985 [Acidobacteriota bacterium]